MNYFHHPTPEDESKRAVVIFANMVCSEGTSLNFFFLSRTMMFRIEHFESKVSLDQIHVITRVALDECTV